MNSVVHNVSAIQATFIMQVALKLIVNVLDDSLKTVEQDKNLLNNIKDHLRQ